MSLGSFEVIQMLRPHRRPVDEHPEIWPSAPWGFRLPARLTAPSLSSQAWVRMSEDLHSPASRQQGLEGRLQGPGAWARHQGRSQRHAADTREASTPSSPPHLSPNSTERVGPCGPAVAPSQ